MAGTRITQLAPTATPGRRYGSFAGKAAAAGIAWTSFGGLYKHRDAVFWGHSPKFQVCMRQTTGTAYARLYDTSGSGAVSGSQISTTSGTFELVESGDLTLVDGHEYRVQFGAVAGDGGEFYSASLFRVPT